MNIVFIKDLQVDAVIGAYDWERNITQALQFDLEMATDIAAAAETDQLTDVLVDYAAVAAFVRDFVGSSQFRLVETLAARLADGLQTTFALPWLRLVVRKPRPDDGFTAGLILERGVHS